MAVPMYYPSPTGGPSQPISPGPAPWLINECRIEGEKCFLVSYQLDGLSQSIPPAHCAHLIATAEEARRAGEKMRTLADASYRHYQRLDLVINYLNLVLHSIKKTLDDITSHYNDTAKSRDMRWRTMYHSMTQEAGGLALPQRFILYNAYLEGLLQLLLKDIHYDDNRFNQDRDRIITLRAQQKLPAPKDLVPQRQSLTGTRLQLLAAREQETHWAQDIFSRPLPSRTRLKVTAASEAFGPWASPGHVIPPGSKVLFEREFDDGALSVTLFLDRAREAPFYCITRRYFSGTWHAQIGAHELGITRNHSTLELKRWSLSENRPVLWAILQFKTWEELVLFYCAFVSLKTNSPLTRHPNPNEFTMAGEKRLFQAKIIDDSYNHSLIVYKDKYAKGWRIHAAVWDGELRQAPMWTAFISAVLQSPQWLRRKSTYRVWLYNIDIYTFNNDYHPESQIHRKSGAFEVKFASEPGAQHFVELFQPSSTEPSEATASTADSDERAADDDDHNRGQVTAVSASTSTSTSNATSTSTSEDGSSVGDSRDHSEVAEDDDDGDDEHSRSDSDDSDGHEGYSEAQSEDAGSSNAGSDAALRGDYSKRLGDYVDYVCPDEFSVEEADDGAGDDSDRSSLGGLSDGATLKIGRRESLLEAPEELHQLEGPEERNRLEAPREPAKITDGRPPKPSVEDVSDDGD